MPREEPSSPPGAPDGNGDDLLGHLLDAERRHQEALARAKVEAEALLEEARRKTRKRAARLEEKLEEERARLEEEAEARERDAREEIRRNAARRVRRFRSSPEEVVRDCARFLVERLLEDAEEPDGRRRRGT